MKKRLYIFSIPILFAVIGLISVQIYWVSNSLSLEKSKLEERVAQSLKNTVELLEKQETIHSLQKHDIGSRLLGYTPENELATISKSELAQSIRIKDTTIIKGNQIYQKRIIEGIAEDTTTGFYSTHKVITPPRLYNDVIPNAQQIYSDDSTKSFHLDQINDQVLIEKSKFVNDIITELFRSNIHKSIHERLTIRNLDSLLKSQFLDLGILADYKFAIFNIQNQQVLLFDEEVSRYNTSLKPLEVFRIHLFPNDLIPEGNLLIVDFPNKTQYLIGKMWAALSASAFLIILVIVVFIATIKTIIKQKKLSVIKNDFINNMTHELKTPISTISLACQMLQDETINSNKGMNSSYVKMIDEENKRLGTLVENVLRTAILDKGELILKYEELDLNSLIKKAESSIQLQLQKKQGKIALDLDESIPFLKGDKIHITNVIFNLLDNAIKYSNEPSLLKVKSRFHNKQIEISVSDNGIGISKEHQKKIFDKLFRVPTGDVHDVKGFGLGLSYVQAIVSKHGGSIHVDSELGKGSTFTIKTPINHENT